MSEKADTGQAKTPARVRLSAFLKRLAPLGHCLLPLLTSLLLILSFPRFGHAALAWLALGPLTLYLLRSKSGFGAMAGGWAAGFFFYLGALSWIYPTMRAGGVEPGVCALGLGLLAGVLALELLLVSAFGYELKKAGAGAFPYVFASAWALMEWGKVTLNVKAVWFPWLMLGHTQWLHPELIQAASVTGVYGVSWAVCFTGALAGAAVYKREKLGETLRALVPGLLLLLGLWYFGSRELAKAPPPGGTLKVTLLQPCVDLYEKWDDAKAASIKAKLDALARGAGKRDLVVWPENALPGWIEDPVYGAWVKQLASETGSPQFVGSVSRGDGKRVAAFLLSPGGAPEAAYHKRILVPFGEYVPFRDLLGKYIEPVGMLGEFYPGGAEQPLMNVGPYKAAPAICYESIFPYLFRADAARGADFFINITNDGWYLDTAAPYQHLAAAVFRAVETRRPVLRAANNGISAYIDPYGRIRERLGLNAEGALSFDAQVQAGAPQSPFVLGGEYFIYACAMLCAAFLLAVLFL